MEFVAETSMETGRTPQKILRNQPLVRRGVKVYNRMDRGIVTINDLSYRDLCLGEMFGGIVDRKQSEKMKRQKREAQQGSGGFV
jgi:hypothetical protein